MFIYLYLLVWDEMVLVPMVGNTHNNNILGNYDVHEKNYENIDFNFVINNLQLHLFF